MAKLGVDFTVHGFRSSLRDWAGDETSFPREVCEGVLAHVVGGVEGAYRRSEALEKRRALLAAWAVYIENGMAAANVIPIFMASSSLSDLNVKLLISLQFVFWVLKENCNDINMLAVRSASSPTGC